MKSFLGKKILVYGMGTSGQAACAALHELGGCVSFYDDENRFGSFYSLDKNPTIHNYDLVVVSPGIKVIGNEIISHFIITKTPVISELDLGFMLCQGRFIGITGTNGKTTTTMLTGQIFKEAGKETFVCGNIGLPLSSVYKKPTKNSYIICEVSNFQLELSSHFFAKTAAILNLAPDHIDRHGSYEEYVRVKKKIINEKRRQKIVLNYDDSVFKLVKVDKRNIYFSKHPLSSGVSVKNNSIFYNKTKIMSVSDIPMLGEKNLENVLAAATIACANRIKPKYIKSAIMTFKPPSHRLEYLGKVNGALVYDDSKATNISAVEGAIESLNAKCLTLLLGGRNKDFKFNPFFEKGYNIDNVICFGECGKEVYDTALNYGYNAKLFDTMKLAAAYVKEFACEGEVILLSPACASFDEFGSYAIRGEVFKEIMFGKED